MLFRAQTRDTGWAVCPVLSQFQIVLYTLLHFWDRSLEDRGGLGQLLSLAAVQ